MHLLFRAVVLASAAFCASILISPAFSPPIWQRPLSTLRDRQRNGLHKSARGLDRMTKQDKVMISKICHAEKSSNWQEVERLISEYDGLAAPVYSAALNAAFRCAKYQAGTKLFLKMIELGITNTEPTYTMGMKLFAKEHRWDMVHKLWAEAQDSGVLGVPSCGARIDAAAEEGDIEGAVKILDLMHQKNLEVGVNHFNSAIKACQNADKPSYVAAEFLFDKMTHAKLRPSIITFSTLMGAYSQAPLGKLQGARAQMAQWGIQPNEVFLEKYVFSVVQMNKNTTSRSPSKLTGFLTSINRDRLVDAATVIDEARANGVRLSGFVRHASKLIKQMRISGMH
eukprot:TRINITY_DN6844_c0_g1_i3.p1 TRINITY_DN6844_c0_g1~~TRINITY_DN6844_c0_g1_i3.p1  ORF type:complete len:340 (-),score=45.64 TRINITY_DN6844_c0_g1_i3:315-1334(-)